MITNTLIKKYLFAALFVVVFFFGFLVRLYKIDTPLADWHSWRQSDTAAVSRIYVDEGINILLPRYYDVSSIQSGWNNPNGYRFVEFPIFNVIHSFLYNLFPRLGFEVWGRLTAVTFSMLSAVVLYLLGNRYLGKSGGILTMFFYLFIPYNVFFSRTILPEPATVFFALVSIFFFGRFIDKDKNLDFFLSSIFFCLAMLMKPYIAFYGVVHLYLLLGKYSIKEILKKKFLLIKLLIFLDIIFVPFFIWRVWMNQFAAGIPHFTWAFNGDGIRFHPAFWRWLFIERLGKMILGVWGLPLFLIGVANSKKNYFVQFFLLGIFLYISVVATANVRHDYYQYFTIPAVSLALASGALFILNNKNLGKILKVGVVVISVLFMLYGGFYTIKDFYNINHPEIVEVGKIVDETLPKDAWVIAPYNGDTAFLYQTKRFGWPVVENNFDELIRRGADYYVTVTPGDKDSNFIEENFKVILKTDKYMIADLHSKTLNK